jgi:hypothetical protein
MKDDTNHAADSQADLLETMRTVRRRLGRLTIAVYLMALALFLTAAAVFGNLVNYFNRDVMLWGGVTAGTAVLAFFFGWLAGRKT